MAPFFFLGGGHGNSNFFAFCKTWHGSKVGCL